MSETSLQETEPGSPPSVARAVAVALVVAAIYVPFVDDTRAWGWDETMHAELAAVHMLFAAQDGDALGVCERVVACHQYPFGYPVVLALVQGVFGVSEAVCRATGRALWVVLALGVFCVVREVGLRRGRPARGDGVAPWLAFGLVLTSPLTLEYSGTLFLEVPFATAASWALWAWLRRQRDGAGPGIQVATGALVGAAFFTKFNYGGLLLLGLGLAAAVEGVERFVAGERRRIVRDLALVALVPGLLYLWWFVWPWPAGDDAAATHRETIWALVDANRQLSSLGWGYRLLHWTSFWVPSPRVFVLVALALVVATSELRSRAGRSLWIVALALVVPVVTHSFYLDRLSIPPGILLFALAGLGLARVLPRTTRARVATLAVLVVLVGAFPSVDAFALAERLPRDDTRLRTSGATFRAADPDVGVAPSLAVPAQPFREGAWTWSSELVVQGAARAENDGVKKLARATPGELVLDPELSRFVDEEPGALVTLRPTAVLPTFPGPERDYVASVVRGYSDLSPARPLATAGLERDAHERFLDLLSDALGPEERLAWIGISSELSPAALHVGLYERAADPVAARRRFREGARAERGGMMIGFANEDPGWTRDELAAFAERFDAIAFTDPIDIKARPARMAFMPRYRDLLLGLGWKAVELGTVAVDVPLREPYDVQLFLARPEEPR